MEYKNNLPNFIFIGPDKSGSTWIYKLLSEHEAVYMSPAKELFYFDRYYNKGLDWYQNYFREINSQHEIIGEVSHDYLYSNNARLRIHNDLPNVRLMVCLREPCERAFSAYLYMLRQGRVRGSFEDAIKKVDQLIDHGKYWKYLEKYLELFNKNNMHVSVFDDLKYSPQRFSDSLFSFLGVEIVSVPNSLIGQVLPASAPKSYIGAKLAKAAANLIRDLGYPGAVGAIKNSRWIEGMLYRQYDSFNKPRINKDFEKELRGEFFNDIKKLDENFNLNLASLWGYV